MAVRMVALVRSKKGEFVARKGIPADVPEPYARLYNVKWEAQLKAPSWHVETRGKNAAW